AVDAPRAARANRARARPLRADLRSSLRRGPEGRECTAPPASGRDRGEPEWIWESKESCGPGERDLQLAALESAHAWDPVDGRTPRPVREVAGDPGDRRIDVR